MSTKIQWTDVTDNIITVKGGGWWCRMISPGCVNCYAAKLNQNTFFGGNKMVYAGNASEMILREDVINAWEHQRIPKKHFVCSMTDVFGDWVTEGMAINFLRGMWRAPKQTFQVLTKRPDIALERINAWLKFDGLNSMPPNIWMGVSVEDNLRRTRIVILKDIPCAVKFISFEPLLEDLPELRLDGIDWAIIGGESGKDARPCDVQWVRNIFQQCNGQGVKVFIKQFGENPVIKNDSEFDDIWPGATIPFHQDYEPHYQGELAPLRFADKKGGDMAEWPEDLRVREFPKTA